MTHPAVIIPDVVLSSSEIEYAQKMLSLWIATTGREVTIVSDPGFQNYINHISRGLHSPPSEPKVLDHFLVCPKNLRFESLLDNCPPQELMVTAKQKVQDILLVSLFPNKN